MTPTVNTTKITTYFQCDTQVLLPWVSAETLCAVLVVESQLFDVLALIPGELISWDQGIGKKIYNIQLCKMLF
jgi:hypothetical protein